jgi:uncharacterized membrane protein YidH (DUF202 family)
MENLGISLILLGIACLIAAIVRGGLKAFQIEIPVISSRTRQVILGAVGVGLILVGYGMIQRPPHHRVRQPKQSELHKQQKEPTKSRIQDRQPQRKTPPVK